MPVSDYTDLVMTVSEYVKRSDLASVINRFVGMTEIDIERTCSFEEQHEKATLTLVAGRATMPADFYKVRSVSTVATPTMRLSRLSKHFEQDPSERGPQGYTLDAGEIVVFPKTIGSVRLSYFAKLPRLSSAAPTNWLLSIAPDVLLSGTIYHALIWAGDDRAASAEKTFIGRMASAQRAETHRRFTNAAIAPERGLP